MKSQSIVSEREFFRTLIKKGRFIKGSFLRLWTYSEAPISTRRSKGRIAFGIIVSRKTSSLATKRNLWRRRIRENVRKLSKDAKQGVAFVIQAGKRNTVPKSSEIQTELRQLFIKAKILK